jgi:hypothetical protein
MKKLRVGFLVSSSQPNNQIVDLINFVAENKNFDEPIPIIITGYKSEDLNDFYSKALIKYPKNLIKFLNIILMRLFIKIIEKIEIRHISKKFPKYQSKPTKNILDSFSKIEVIGSWSKSDESLEFINDDMELISQQNLDCIIHCGSEILKGDILNSQKFGVISFLLGDSFKNKREPHGFW